MFRASFRSISRINGQLPSKVLRLSSNFGQRSNQLTSIRNYATNQEGGEILANLTQKIQNSPGVMDALMDVQKIMTDKGIDIKGGNLSPMQYVKIFSDKKIRDSFQKFSQEMEKAEIRIDPSQIESLMKVLGIDEKKNL